MTQSAGSAARFSDAVENALTWRLDPDTVGCSLIAATRQNPHGDALIMDGRRVTYAELLDDVLLWSRALIGAGVRKGDHVGVLMPNCWDYILLFYATNMIGATACTLNARYREADLRFVIPNADVSLLIIGGQAWQHSDFRAMVCNVFPGIAAWNGTSRLQIAEAPELRGLYNLDDPRETQFPTKSTLLAGAEPIDLAAVQAMAESTGGRDISLLMFSSGTTSNPKACMISHFCLNATGRALSERFRMVASDRFWDPLPYFHMSTMLPLAACRASTAAFIGTAHFDAGKSLDTIEQERASILYSSFPMITNPLVHHASFDQRDLSSVRLVENVGPVDLLRLYADKIPNAVHINCYGLTEASGVPVYSELTDTFEQRTQTSGRPFPGVEIRIADPDTLEPMAQGGIGEIWIRGFVVFSGYYGDEAKTRDTITPEGWLRTGDIGSLDPNGRLIYRGRFKDMLKIGGENVAAVELESYLHTHPAVQLAQVVGVPDDHLIEVACAFIEFKPGATATEQELVDYCIGKIASYKIPRYIRFVSAWPMSATKVQKFKLTQTFTPTNKFDVRALVTASRTKG